MQVITTYVLLRLRGGRHERRAARDRADRRAPSPLPGARWGWSTADEKPGSKAGPIASMY
jgi:hypothetical protein